MNKIKHIIVRSVLVVLLVAVGGGNLYAQKSQLSGTVSDAENTPLVGASIIVEGTHVGTTTDADGAFLPLRGSDSPSPIWVTSPKP